MGITALVKNRDFDTEPSFWYSDNLEWSQSQQAAIYVMENKLGSSGGQKNADELGLFGSIVKTHRDYSKRGEFTVKRVRWGCIDILKINGGDKLDNFQFDKLLQQMVIEDNPLIKHDPNNTDGLIIKTGPDEYRPLTSAEIVDALNKIINGGRKRPQHHPHTRQLELKHERELFAEGNKDADLIVHFEGNHTRIGKDKINYISISPEVKIVIDMSGYFATWQITSEFKDGYDVPVYTRGKTSETILTELIIALEEQKRPWLMLSTYNNEDSDRIELLSLLKCVNIHLIIDEVDYQVWKQVDLIRKIIENVC